MDLFLILMLNMYLIFLEIKKYFILKVIILKKYEENQLNYYFRFVIFFL